MKNLSPFTLAAVGVAALLLMSFVGNLHYASALTDEAIEKDARPKRVLELYGRGHRPDLPQRLVLMNPLECDPSTADATVNTRVYLIEQGRTRCYVRGER